MRLADLLDSLGTHSVTGSVSGDVRAVHHDSRAVGPHDLFVAVPGAHVDGRRFVPGLRCAGVLTEGPVQAEPGVPVITVPDARAALARAAAALAGHPGRTLPIVGITGTNGKTTTAALFDALAAGVGWRTAIVGTTGHRVAGRAIASTHTTPEAPVLQGLLAEARDAGCDVAAMEVSSIGLSLRRADAIPFRVAVFTSFSRDHLDFHGDMEAYFNAKARLFSELVDPAGVSVLAGDDPAAARLRPRTARTWRATLGPGGDLAATELVADLSGTTATVRTPVGIGRLHVPLIGSFNLMNGLLALGAGLALDAPLDAALAGIRDAPPVPGRLESVAAVRALLGATGLVDYAHTPDALRLTLSTLRGLAGGKVITVFGCGGDRDRGKRPEMGSAASTLSDHTIVTSDNPRSERPGDILADIRPGLTGSWDEVPDRAEAIHRALSLARPGDVVLVAGKGHETGQIVGTEVRPFSDRAVLARAAAAVAESAGATR